MFNAVEILCVGHISLNKRGTGVHIIWRVTVVLLMLNSTVVPEKLKSSLNALMLCLKLNSTSGLTLYEGASKG